MEKSKIRIASLVSYKIFPPTMGGQRGIALFNKYLAGEVKLLCLTTKSNDPKFAEGYEMINVFSDNKLRYINPFYFFRIRRILKEKGITHLQLEHPYYGWLAVWLKRSLGIKLIVHSHNIEGRRWKTLGKWWWKILWSYEKWTHRKADYNYFKQNEDLNYAVDQYKLDRSRCKVITYGIEWNKPPTEPEHLSAREYLLNQHSIPADHTILLFNGAFNYQPNLTGLLRILDKIVPKLESKDFRYTILICGRDIPQYIREQKNPNTIIVGFVDDIGVYFKGSDIFLNPVIEGGGIKTKLVEALGHNMNAVSTHNGAIGVDPALCNGKLVVREDDDWDGFSESIIKLSKFKATINDRYFEHFFWGNIVKKAIEFISEVLPQSKKK